MVYWFFFASCSSAFAADGDQPRKKKRSKAQKTTNEEVSAAKAKSSADTDSHSNSDPSSVKAQDSRSTRSKQKQNYSLLYTPLSDFLLKYGAQGQLVQSPSLQLGLFVLMGSETKNQNYESGTLTTNGSGTGFSLHARYFLGNSFNVMGGVGYRAANFKMEFKDNLLGDVEGELKVQGIALPIFIGNQWTWPGGFTLGVDWLGAWVPISGKSQASMKGKLSDKDLEDLTAIGVQVGNKLAKTTTLTLFLTSIGWAF